MLEYDVAYVPTRAMIDLILATGGESLPRENWVKLVAIAGAHLEAYQGAVKAGVKIVMGIDSGPGGPSALELQSAVEKVGLSPLEAIKAATADGPLCMHNIHFPSTEIPRSNCFL
jgi:imidazolonepropionase-like amidohydrolase